MYFEFDDYRPDITPVGRAISWREGVLISIIVRLAMLVFMLAAPRLFPYDAKAARARALLLQQQAEQAPRFVFVQPRLDFPAPKPPARAEDSDQDRLRRSPQQVNPTNPLPFSRGNTPERVEQLPQEIPRGQGPAPEPAAGQQAENNPPPETAKTQLPALKPPAPQDGANGRAPTSGGALGEALRNLQRYVQRDQLENQQGNGQFGPEIQFDTKGVEFGPWIRRFIAQVKRNWFIPYVAMSMKGPVDAWSVSNHAQTPRPRDPRAHRDRQECAGARRRRAAPRGDHQLRFDGRVPRLRYRHREDANGRAAGHSPSSHRHRRASRGVHGGRLCTRRGGGHSRHSWSRPPTDDRGRDRVLLSRAHAWPVSRTGSRRRSPPTPRNDCRAARRCRAAPHAAPSRRGVGRAHPAARCEAHRPGARSGPSHGPAADGALRRDELADSRRGRPGDRAAIAGRRDLRARDAPSRRAVQPRPAGRDPITAGSGDFRRTAAVRLAVLPE